MACYFLTVDVSSIDLSSASGNTGHTDGYLYITYIDCDGVSRTDAFTTAGNNQPASYCYTSTTSPELFYYKNDVYTTSPMNSVYNQMMCEYYDVEITSEDISNATGNTGINEYRNGVVFVTYRPCSGGTQTILYTTATYYGNALCNDNAYGITIDVWQNGAQISYTSQAIPTGICCGGVAPTVTLTPTPTVTSTPTNTQTSTNTPTPTPTKTNTPTPTQTSTNTQTPTPTTTPNSTPTNTPTTSVTSTPTPTPTTTPQPTQVYRLSNDCDVFTLFPLGVECMTLSNVSSPNSVDGVLSLKITGGTSPYTISWNNGQKTRTISGISAGSYEAQVIDYYGDYTATTICSLLAPTPSPTPTLTTTPTPTSSGTYPSLCLSILTCPAITPIQFTSGSIQNGKPSWSSVAGYSIVWNVTLQQWEIQNYTVFGGKIVSKTTSIPPLSGWFVQGGTSSPTVAMTLGTCPSYAPLNTTIQKTDSDCSNNGSIVISTCGGLAPYQYSIDGGSTFTTSNIFNNLAPQTYNVVVKDSLGNTSTATSTISSSSAGVTSYAISVANYSSTTINAGYIRSSWSVNVVPPIPQGTQISFDLVINSTQIVNGPGSGTTSSLTNVYSGDTLLSTNNNDTNTTIITRDNCSPETSTITNINEVYNVTIGYGYGISGVTFSTLDITSGETSLNGCVTNLTQSISVFASTGIISGCDCCSVSTDSLSYGGVENHSLNLGQGQTSKTYYSFIVGVGTTESSACSNELSSITRLINQSTFGVGATIYSGSPANPKPLIGYDYCSYNQLLYYMSNKNGQVTGIVLSTGNQHKAC